MERRDFLQTLTGGALLSLGNCAWALSTPGNGDASARRLIVVMLRGAVDGLSVVAPYADPDYRAARPTIALARPGEDGGVLDLDGRFGLHPALADLLPLWQSRRLAFVHASGSPDPTRSHFDAQDYLESGTPGRKSTPDGWLNRLAAALPGQASPTRAISIGAVLPRILVGSAPATTIADNMHGRFRSGAAQRPAATNAFDALYRNDPRLRRTYADAQTAREEISAAMLGQEMNMADGGAPLPNGFPGSAARLAKLMRSDANIRLAFIALGGWDTHANQGAAKGQLANRLAPLGQGLAELARQLGPVFDDTAIVVMSEFGRTVRENGSGGTDHGHGNVMWLLGSRVAGGQIAGKWPGLQEGQRHEGRDLAVTTDFRAVLAQVMQYHLGLGTAALGRVVPGGDVPPLGQRLFMA